MIALTSEGMMAAQRWAIFAERLAPDAVADLDRLDRGLGDAEADVRATSADQRRTLATGRIQRARADLAKARGHRAQVRKLLWPADPER